MPSMLPSPVRGIIPPMVTPLSDHDTLDRAGLERLIEHILAGGTAGLFILGTTGEGPALSYRLRREMIGRTCAQVNGRVPVFAAITDTSFTEAVEMARFAAASGAAAVVAAAPYYFIASQPELLGYITRLAERVPLPLFLYNMPSLTKVGFEPETVARAAEIPGIAGLKDSSASMIYLHRVQRLLRGNDQFTLLVGPEELLAESVLAGAHGGVNGGANLHPRLYVDTYEAAQRGERATALRLHDRIMDLSAGIYRVDSSPSSYLRGLKCALALLGLCCGELAEPYRSFGPAETRAVQEALESLGLLSETTRARRSG